LGVEISKVPTEGRGIGKAGAGPKSLPALASQRNLKSVLESLRGKRGAVAKHDGHRGARGVASIPEADGEASAGASAGIKPLSRRRMLASMLSVARGTRSATAAGWWLGWLLLALYLSYRIYRKIRRA
jgi:hypothetical protein